MCQQVTGDEVIIVDVPSYLVRFSEYLKTVPARVQVNSFERNDTCFDTFLK